MNEEFLHLPHAPKDHPPTKKGKVGVLISNLGTPDHHTYWPVRRYLSEFLSDKRVIDYPRWLWFPLLHLIILSKRPFSSGAAYRSIWNMEQDESPLITITKRQKNKLDAVLKSKFGDKIITAFSMRYGNPSTPSVLNQMIDAGCRKILHFPLYPHYSASTTASANDALFHALTQSRWQPSIRTVAPYFDHQSYIDALAKSVNSHLDKMDFVPDLVVTSYHGLPQRYLRQGDPYHCHCQKTSRLLTERLKWDEGKIVTSFQSRFGFEEWLKPYTVEKVAELAQNGKRKIAIMAPGFSSDCIETLEEIQEEIQESFIAAGGERFAYIPCLNDDDNHIKMMADLVYENIGGWLDV